MVALSMRLRLSPQSRIDPKTLTRQQVPEGGGHGKFEMTDAERKTVIFSLMAPYNQLGRLLPQPDEFDTRNAAAVAEAEAVIAEMKKTMAAIDALLQVATGRTQ
jgi:hypothetical protein